MLLLVSIVSIYLTLKHAIRDVWGVINVDEFMCSKLEVGNDFIVKSILWFKFVKSNL